MNKGRTHKQLKQDYETSPPPMGVFLIRNMVNDKVFVGIGLNLPGIINRHKFELAAGSHRSKQLQKDWNELGTENFAFEIVDQLDPAANPDRDPRADLQSLEDLWLEKLRPYGDRGYNEPKLSREEKLRLIAANRRGEF
jgi:hypothetical protein